MNAAQLLAKGALTPEALLSIQRIDHPKRLIELAATSPHVDIQNVIDHHWTGEVTDVTVIPPWSNCVCFGGLRYSNFASLTEHTKVAPKDRDGYVNYASLLLHNTDIDVVEKLKDWHSGFINRVNIFITGIEHFTTELEWAGVAIQVLNEKGFVFARGMALIDRNVWRDPDGNLPTNEDLLPTFTRYNTAPLVAFAFCNCRNIQIEKVLPSRQQRRWSERHKLPVYEHHRIVIDPMKPILRREGGLDEHGDLIRAMHICRGHFAHYGEQYGRGKLFGKHEGQFWMPQHVRGSLEHGVVTKDYAMAAKKG